MRLVYTKLNYELLSKYYDEILLPFFNFLVELKENNLYGYARFRNQIGLFKNVQSLPEDYPILIFTSNNETIFFENLINEIISNNSLVDIKEERKIFISQNNSLFKGVIPTPYKINEPLYKIFSKLFYEVLFDSKECWSFIDPNIQFNRKVFFRNFSEENTNICPLCDVDTINAKSNSIVEHFLPRNLYPYLSLNPLNLISTCNACNKSEQGKGSKIFLPVSHPYFEPVGPNIKFEIQSALTNSILFVPPDNDLWINNFEKTIKLKSRYCDETISNIALNKLKSDKRMIDKLIRFGESKKSAYEFYSENLSHEIFYYFRNYYLIEDYK